MSNYINKIIYRIFDSNTKTKLILGVCYTLLIPIISTIVYYTGGIKYVYSHTMYIPIILLGVSFGFKYGLASALISGLFLGPLMPLDVSAGVNQDLFNWLYRLFIFIIVGSLTGLFSDAIRRQRIEKTELLSYNQISGLRLFSSLEESEKEMKEHSEVFILRVANYQSIIDHLGLSFYLSIWKHIHTEFHIRNIVQGEFYHVENRIILFIPNSTNTQVHLNELRVLLENSHTVENFKVYLDVYIGHCYGETKLDEKVQNAMKAARYGERNFQSYNLYKEEMHSKKLSFSLIAEVKQAIDSNQFYMVYQPVVDFSNNLFSFESLIRWNHPVHGNLSPGIFLKNIEQTNLIHALTKFVFAKVKDDLIEMAVENDFLISINLSTKNIINLDLMRELTSDKYFNQEQKEHIVIEITETVLIENTKIAEQSLNMIKNSGMKVALDDFGTGYSSLAYLGNYPLDIVKIDKTFTFKLSNKSINNIINTAVDLSHSMDYKVVVEGVETEYIFNKLLGCKCDYVQGYHIAKPLTIDKVYNLINNKNLGEYDFFKGDMQ